MAQQAQPPQLAWLRRALIALFDGDLIRFWAWSSQCEGSMRPLTASELLDIWERGQGQPAVQQALLLLAAACSDVSPEQLARMSIGQRDSLLLTLREWTFGSRLVSLASCPSCAERLELAFEVADIRTAATPSEPLRLELEGYRLEFRLPNSLDLLVLAGQPDASTRRLSLLERCVLTAEHDANPCAPSALPTSVVTAVATAMAAADPQADVQLDLCCPACARQWQAPFDIVGFFWSEISAWAYRTLREVHALARAYGWREADILALSAWRRQCYLEMARG